MTLAVAKNQPVTKGKDATTPSPDSYFAPFNKLTEEIVLRQPDWNPSIPPPKTVEELTKLVVDAYTPPPDQPKTGWVLESITYFHVPNTMWTGLKHTKEELLKDKWYCRIYITSFGDYHDKWWRNQAEANVFLDGTIIQPATAIK